MAKRGRPRIPESERRTVTLRIRFTRRETLEISRIAREKDLSAAEVVRQAVLESISGKS